MGGQYHCYIIRATAASAAATATSPPPPPACNIALYEKTLGSVRENGRVPWTSNTFCGASRQLATSASQQLNTSAQERGLLDLQTKLAGKVSSIVSVFNLRVSRSVGDLRSPGW